ncbi:gluconate permease GntP [Brachybacterium alimentarium]|uniref:Gluconate permease n=1 Tax=Brachybacterium alimentarium TaxID=47845 RepID=A0A2A3YL41_9MICO|nr:gluconate permease GntP [Brachybacterium alimentarium]PCC40017.1 gluconate permease [Brachybacterium alimentarium]RCS71282.1 gluconate transporter GntP [Brachybacterium alimentarium]RCS87323.1 gluconate transporter GntP [Brachybacterium alimentarium]
MALLHVLWIALGIALMLWLNMKYKLNAMLALLLAALFIGVAEMVSVSAGWLPGDAITLGSLLETMTTGFGSTLGSLAILVVFGAVIGKLMVDSGAATQIAQTLIATLGVRWVKVSLVVCGLVFGLAMFYEVAFIVLAPLIIAVAHEAKLPFMKLAIPAVAATTTAHSLFVPQPGPVALVDAYGADNGMVYIYGIPVAIVTIAVTGWVLPRFLGTLDFAIPEIMQADEVVAPEDRPSFAVSLLTPLIPVAIMVGATVANIWLVEDTLAYDIVNFVGSSEVAITIAMIAAFVLFGTAQKRDFSWVMERFEEAVRAIAMVVLIIGAGGALKEVIIDTGIGDFIGTLMTGVDANPYVMAWLITVLLRLATGQGVVSAMTAAGIIGAAVIDPSTGAMTGGIDPALLVLATAAGSNTFTHVNDAAFWLFKGYFGLSVKDTLKTWGLFQLCNSLVGLGMVLLLSVFVG